MGIGLWRKMRLSLSLPNRISMLRRRDLWRSYGSMASMSEVVGSHEVMEMKPGMNARVGERMEEQQYSRYCFDVA